MKRKFGLDLIRSIAVFFVVSVHFYINTKFYRADTTNPYFIPLFIARNLFFTCVPLFLLLTGYLKRNKKISPKYYAGIKKVISSYLIISIICVFFNRYYLHLHLGKIKAILSIFDFTACGYSWYIEMYIGLFLLIPFINVMYNNLTKKKKKLLIITLLLLISLPSILNSIKFGEITVKIIPNWWLQIYPLLYYVIGCYIGEYEPRISKKKLTFYLLSILIIIGFLSYELNLLNIFKWNFYYGTIITVLTSTMIFLLLYDIDINNKTVKKIITSISTLSLDIYLFSYISDKLIYSNIPIPKNTIKYCLLYFLTVPASFILAYILSYIKSFISKSIKKAS